MTTIVGEVAKNKIRLHADSRVSGRFGIRVDEGLGTKCSKIFEGFDAIFAVTGCLSEASMMQVYSRGQQVAVVATMPRPR